MSSSIENRLNALTDAAQRRAMEQIAPVDGLSQSLFALQHEFSRLDDAGKVQLLNELNNPADNESSCLNLSLEDVTKFISDFTQ